MAADVKFRLNSDDSLITGSEATPYAVTTPAATLYRGMAVAVEYGYCYAKNEGADALASPSHTLVRTSNEYDISSYYNRKVTDHGTAAVKIDWGTDKQIWTTAVGYQWGPTEIEASTHTMPVNQTYGLYSRYRIGWGMAVGAADFKHSIGGS